MTREITRAGLTLISLPKEDKRSNKRFFRIFTFLLVIIFSVACVFTACGKDKDGDDSGDKGSGTTTEKPAGPGTQDTGDEEHIRTLSHVTDVSADCENEKNGYYNTFYDGVFAETINEDGRLCVAVDDFIALDITDSMAIDVGIPFDTTLDKTNIEGES